MRQVAVVIRNLTRQSLFRYLLVGGTAFALEYAAFSVLFSLLGVQLFVANSLSFFGGLVTSFGLQRAWAFKKDRKNQFQKTFRHQFLLYAGLALFNLLMINLLLGYLTGRGLDPQLGKILTMAVIVVWNFFIMKLVIFRRGEQQ